MVSMSVGQIAYVSVFLFPGIRRRSSHPISDQLKEWAQQVHEKYQWHQVWCPCHPRTHGFVLGLRLGLGF